MNARGLQRPEQGKQKTHEFICKSFNESGTDIDLVFKLLVSDHLDNGRTPVGMEEKARFGNV